MQNAQHALASPRRDDWPLQGHCPPNAPRPMQSPGQGDASQHLALGDDILRTAPVPGGAKGGKGGRECRGVGEAWSPQFGTCAAPSWPRACARRPLGDRSARPRVACAFGKCHPSSAPNRLDRRFLGTERPAGKTRPGSLPRSGPFPMHCKNLAAEEGL